MSREIKAERNQAVLLPERIEDYIPKDHPARFIDAFVGELDMQALGFAKKPKEKGRPHFSPQMLLSVWLYGYFCKIRSTRGLEEACYNNMGMIWLTGRNFPDHNTLWLFFKEHKAAMKGLFKQSVKIAWQAGLVELALVAVDGTTLKSAGSIRSTMKREKLKKVEQKLDALVDQSIREIEKESADALGYGRLPEELQTREGLKEAVQTALKLVEEANVNRLNTNEPEARTMKMKEGGMRLGYNAQVATDVAHGIVTGCDVVNEANDRHQLKPMLQDQEETFGRPPDLMVADSGYATPSQLQELMDKGAQVLTADPNPGKKDSTFSADKFDYDPHTGLCICPLGKKLEFEREKKAHRGHLLKLFRCRHRDCPSRDICSKDSKGRVWEASPYHEAVQYQREARKFPGAKKRQRQRSMHGELSFARIKQLEGFLRFTAWGMEGAKAQFQLICTTLNIRKLFKKWKMEMIALPTST
jgi:transposase